jgi:hypothetical protein
MNTSNTEREKKKRGGRSDKNLSTPDYENLASKAAFVER